MASYVFDLALVKYYRESLDEYATFMPFKIANTKDQTFYAKISVITQGNLLWYLDDGAGNLVTEKTYTINANSVLSLNEKLVATSATLPSETTKDQVTLKVEYFKDAELTQKFGEDLLTINVHIYIQKSDGSWTSSTYSTESDIVFEKFDFSNIDVDFSTDKGIYDLNGGLGAGKMRFFMHTKYGGHLYLKTTTGIVESNALRIGLYVSTNSYGDSFTTLTNIWITDINDNWLTDKFVAMVLKNENLTEAKVGFTNDPEYYRDWNRESYNDIIQVVDDLSTAGTIKKIVFLPFQNLTHIVYLKIHRPNETRFADVDGVYVFNKLP